jgi:nudix-type nucleoside diphosphatase (YffH/AdpP family)
MKAVVEKCRVLLDGFFHVEEVDVSFELRQGAMSSAVRRLNLKRKLAAALVLVNPAKQTVILVRQFRYAALEHGNAWMVEVVAGLIDAGESPEAAIRREAVEEAGYDVGKLELITTFFTTPGLSSERIALFYGETKGAEPVAKGGGLAAEGEDIEVLELPYAEAFAMLDRGEIVDGKTLIGLLWLKDKLQPRSP